MQTQASGWASKYKFGVNTRWGPGPVNTNWGPGPVNSNWGPGPVNTRWGPGPGARAGSRGQAKGRGPGNTNTRCLRLSIYNLCVQMKMWWDIIVWNLYENIGLILRIFNSFAFTRIAFKCWYTQNIFNLTYLQTNLFLYIYVSGSNLPLTKSDCIFHLLGLVFGFWLTEYWVIRKHFLFGVTICFKQLKVLSVLCS